MEYTVISDRYLTGTISDLPYPARLAWVAILFEAEKLRGRVKLPIRDLAKKASITTEEADEALQLFLGPDKYSSSKEEGGRRLLPVDGETDWYTLTTWEKHAAEKAAFFARLRQQRKRARKAAADESDVTVSHGESRSVTKYRDLNRDLNLKEEQTTSDDVVREEPGSGEETPSEKLSYLRSVINAMAPALRPRPTDAQLSSLIQSHNVYLMAATITEKWNYLSGKGIKYLASMFAAREQEGWTTNDPIVWRDFVAHAMAAQQDRKPRASGYVVRITMVEFDDDAQFLLFDEEGIA